MKWLLEKSVRLSDKNGFIRVVRPFGRWHISVKDCGQTSPYTHAMWIDAYRRLTRRHTSPITKILMLGLGAGGELKLLYKTFPQSSLTVVEYDPEMIRLTLELCLFKPYPAPRIIEGDAASVVPSLQDTFDLIIVDLFNGPEPSPLSADSSFVRALCAHINPQGVALFNVYKRSDYLDSLKRFFTHSDCWVFKFNHLGAFTAPKEAGAK